MLELVNVNAQYGEIKSLYDVSLRAETGQTVAVIGSNGAGKSTVVSIISGLVKPVSGQVRFEDADITDLKPHEIVELGVCLIPEGRLVFSQMSVNENLLVGSIARRAKLNRAASLKLVFEIFPILYDRKEQLAGRLSGGEQQMLAIGRGLMSNPKLLMLDEPSLGLAPLIVQDIFNVLSELNKRGFTILLIDQNLTQALKISNYNYVLENGRVVLEGTSDRLMADEHLKRAYLGL